jgi:CHAD domain-containing protein
MGRRELSPEAGEKFDLRPDTEPDLTALLDVKGVHEIRGAGVHRLTATYYDTADLALLRHGATLRRRTGGTDPGWQVTLPTTGGQLEAHRPAGRSNAGLPAELGALVRAMLRGQQPQRVVQLRTTRQVSELVDRDGGVLAEVADDTVTAQIFTAATQVFGQPASTTSWREIEVELVEGRPKLLAAVGSRLRRDGATPSAFDSELARALDGHQPTAPVPNGHLARRRRAGSVVLTQLRIQRDELVACDPKVRLDLTDSVHRMRVATRRLRSALASFRPLFAPDTTTALRTELAWLACVLGAARDAEVLRDLLDAELAAVPAPLVHGPIAERLRSELDDAYRRAHAVAVTELNGTRYLDLLTALDTFIADPPLTSRAHLPARDVLPGLVARTTRRVNRELRAAMAEPELEQRELRSHEVRKAAKRARYAAEAVTATFGNRARALARQMRQVQETLGSHQDSLLAREWLLAAADRAHAAGEPTFTHGFLYARQAGGDGDTDANLATAAALLAAPGPAWQPRAARRQGR